MLVQEVFQTLRSLRRTPGFAAVSVLTIGLGVGASTAMYSVVKAVLLNPLPYPQPERLAWVAGLDEGRQQMRTSFPDFDDWQKQNHTFSSLAAFSDGPFLTGGGQNPERIQGAIVTEQFFETFGVSPALGRVFSPDEQAKGALFSGVVIGHDLWQRGYGGDPKIIGRRIKVLGWPATVVGVMPAGFAFPEGTELWASARALGEGYVRSAHNFWVAGRLRPGATTESASRDLSNVARALKRQYPGPFQVPDATVVPLATHLTANVHAPLWILFGAVGVLLLMVCVNVATLFLVRGTLRSRELTVRLALGARPADLFRHLSLESLVLAAFGTAAGLLLAAWSVEALRVLLPATVPRAADVRIDAAVVAFAAALAACTGLLFGVFPSWQAVSATPQDVLKSRSTGATLSRRSQMTQGALVSSQVALSMVLLAAAGLLAASFLRLRSVDPGFQTARVLSADLSFPMSAEEALQIAPRYQQLLERVRGLSGVESAGTMKDLPLQAIQRDGHFFIRNWTGSPGGSQAGHHAGYRPVSPQLMETLHIPLIRGRRLNDSDTSDSPGVAVINAEMARRYWPGRDPIGEQIWIDGFEPKERWLTIVGIAANIRQTGLTEPAQPEVYVCSSQIQIKGYLGTGHLLARISGDPDRLIPALRREIRAVHPEAAASFTTMDEVLARATSRHRFQMQVLLTFALLALALASVGLYGVLSYSVSSSRPAIGIRMALGAPAARVFRMVVARALWFTLAGVAAGLIGCVALRGVLEHVIFGVGPTDPVVLFIAAATLVSVAFIACWFPARRAMHVDPVSVLREE